MPEISNYDEALMVIGGEDKIVRTYKSVKDVISQMKAKTGGWPKVLEDGTLFTARKPKEGLVPDPGAITQIQKPSHLKAWMGLQGKRRWTEGEVYTHEGGRALAATIEDVFFAMTMSEDDRFTGVEQMPHEPKLDSVFYLERELPEGDGSALEEFLDLLNWETTWDRGLLKAAVLTTVAGLPPGGRPSFVFKARRQGAGKTKTAEAIASLTGGVIGLQPNQNFDRLLQAFFDRDSVGRRVVLVDNVKKPMDSGPIESLITARVVQGHRLHVGRGSRTNHLTWFITANRPKLSADLASRSVVVGIGSPRTGINFEEKMQRLISEKRMEIVADCLDILRNGPRHRLSPLSRIRFYEWEELVLRRIEGCDDLGKRIRERQKDVNIEADASQEIRDALVEQIEKSGANADHDRVVIPWSLVSAAIDKAERADRKTTNRKAGERMRTLMGQGALWNVDENTAMRLGRGVVWTGEHWDREDPDSITKAIDANTKKLRV